MATVNIQFNGLDLNPINRQNFSAMPSDASGSAD